MSIPRPKWRRRKAAFWVFVAALNLTVIGLAELSLRTLGLFETWTERTLGFYSSRYDFDLLQPWYLITKPETLLPSEEFSFEIEVNSEGLRDIEHPEEKPQNEFRVLGLGDSFSMGFGAANDEGYLKVLERELSLRSERTVRVIVGGAPGSDPVFNHQHFRRRLARYQPDLIILLVNTSDLDDLIVRGGADRFKHDGFLKERRPPSVERLFQRSHLARGMMLFLGYDENLIFRRRGVEQALATIESISTALRRDGARGQCFLLATVPQFYQLRAYRLAHPTQAWVMGRKAENEFAPLIESLAKKDVHAIDTLDAFDHAITDVSDLWRYYWRQDHHLTATGYEFLGKTIADFILAERMLSEQCL